MIIKIIALLIIILIFVVYKVYFKHYYKVKSIYETLRNFLDVRDSLVLKLIPEIKNNNVSENIIALIEERKENFKTSYNNSIKADAKLNSSLRFFYEEVNKLEKNEVINSVFKKVIKLEKDLKNIRNEYTLAVEEYNNNLIRHKFVCLKIIKMKPLDTYKIKGK